MQKQSIPSPDYKIFNSYSDGYKFLSNHEGAVVVKANGLASGKGAIVCRDQEAAINALYDCMEDRVFGASGDSVVIEELLEGEEISVFAFTDGSHVASCGMLNVRGGQSKHLFAPSCANLPALQSVHSGGE